MTDPRGATDAERVRALVVGALLALVTSSCAPAPAAATAVQQPAPPSPMAAPPRASFPPRAARLTRPAMARGDPPVLLRAVVEAGTFGSPSGGWRYDGARGALEQVATADEPLEHPAPAGTLAAIEHVTPTPGGYLMSTELAIRDRTGGPERVIYRAPQRPNSCCAMFYWSGWSPDGRFVALWAIDSYSGSVDQDGRPLLVIDAVSGDTVDLGRTLLHGTTAWTSPHTLAFVSGAFRMLWEAKALRLWSPEKGIRQVTHTGSVGFAPAWNADGRTLYFAGGPEGQYEPLAVFAGRGAGDHRISVYDVATGTARSLAHEPGFIEEGARPSRDGTRLLVLRRRTVEAADIRSIPDAPFEMWLTDADGAHGTALLRIAHAFGAYGWSPDPSEWEWSE